MKCGKRINETMQCGTKISRYCNRESVDGGYCSHHTKRMLQKSVNWEDRETYRSATQLDLDGGRSLKLRGTNHHTIYRVRKNVVQQYSSSTNKWHPVVIDADASLFVVKI